MSEWLARTIVRCASCLIPGDRRAEWLEEWMGEMRALEDARTGSDPADRAGSSPGDRQGSGGSSVDASVRIEGEDRAGIERLVRYCARPPFALERLQALEGAAALASPDSRLLYRFPKPDVNGRTEILLTPLELLERLARFVPPGTDAKRWSRAPPPLSRRPRTERDVALPVWISPKRNIAATLQRSSTWIIHPAV